jgi:hypothetical protein
MCNGSIELHGETVKLKLCKFKQAYVLLVIVDEVLRGDRWRTFQSVVRLGDDFPSSPTYRA